ncbi:biotin-dependent carboxyltransferase family protein [Sporosarcina sp. HYO08]|uniref:5-oxoprolinase subunit C family protein n=1 Tax=Sporosarcina sp. HYO08 TaxID=1759557 RepID=UPI000794EDA3|nr:biotin-dependent carboxyltransferase family protein [Sporosarcina sp. HYO08]KXH81673.1 KipI antagonist [Sporosarcina sp. HYO08]
MTVQVLHPGLLTTIQDLGRFGSQQYGVIASGAMDPYSLRIANLLVGNEQGEGALEVTLMGTSLAFQQDRLIAITGGDLRATIDGERAPMWRPIVVREGSVLTFDYAVHGCRAYVAFAGGIDIPKVMGSKSTYMRAGIGGFNGRALQKGDIFHCGEMGARSQSLVCELKDPLSWSVNYHTLLNVEQTQTIRVLKGTEFDRFEKKSQQALFTESYTLTTNSDRMGSRLEGAALSLREEFELLSEGVTYGTIQVPPNGQPIILMADRQTTGGYPKIGQVMTADLPSLAQLRPGGAIQFKEVSLEEAEKAFIRNERIIQEIKMAIQLVTS